MNRVIVFTRTSMARTRWPKSSALRRGGGRHPRNKSQNARQRALDMFESGRRACWWRPIAARGIDVEISAMW